MSRILLVALSCGLIACGSAAAQFAPEQKPQKELRASFHNSQKGPFRHTSLDHAWASAQSRQLPLLLYVTSDNCLYCKKMLKQTLSHPKIGLEITTYTVPVAVNASRSPRLARKLGVRSFPTVLLISPHSEILCKVEGFLDPQKFAERLWPVLRQMEQDRRVIATANSGGPTTSPTVQ